MNRYPSNCLISSTLSSSGASSRSLATTSVATSTSTSTKQHKQQQHQAKASTKKPSSSSSSSAKKTFTLNPNNKVHNEIMATLNGEVNANKNDLLSAQNFMLYSQQQQQLLQNRQSSVSNTSYFDCNSSTDLASTNNQISFVGNPYSAFNPTNNSSSSASSSSNNKFSTDLRHCFSLRKNSINPIATTTATCSTASSDIYTDYGEERHLIRPKGIVCLTDGASTSFKFVKNNTETTNHNTNQVENITYYQNNHNNNNNNGFYPQIKYVL